MYKDFEGRNKEKQLIDASDNRVLYPKPREIWYIKMGINIGREMHGKGGFLRPVLVLSKIGSMYFCLAMSTKAKNRNYGIKLHYPGAPDDSYVVINQGRIYDSKRFFKKVEMIAKNEYAKIKNLLRNRYFPRDF